MYHIYVSNVVKVGFLPSFLPTCVSIEHLQGAFAFNICPGESCIQQTSVEQDRPAGSHSPLDARGA